MPAATVLALWPDLMFATKITEAAGRLGVTASVAQTPDDLFTHIATAAPALIIVDLEMPGLAVADVVSRVRAGVPEAMLVGVGTHTDPAPRAQAQAAGAQMVMVRSDFAKQLLALLTKYGS